MKLSDFVFYTEVRRAESTFASRREGASSYEPVLPDGYKMDISGRVWGPDGNVKKLVRSPSNDMDARSYLRGLGYAIDD